MKKLLNRKYEILSLVKPQFEARKNEVGRGGIIKDSKIHQRICEELMLWFKQNFDYEECNHKVYPEKTEIVNVTEHGAGYGVMVYEGYIGEDKVLFTAEDVY